MATFHILGHKPRLTFPGRDDPEGAPAEIKMEVYPGSLFYKPPDDLAQGWFEVPASLCVIDSSKSPLVGGLRRSTLPL